MAVDTTWTNPTTAKGSGGLDFTTGDTIDEATLDRYASDLYRLGGADGNSKTGPYTITQAANEVLTVLSGASGTGPSIHVGRTVGEARLAVASSTGQWMTGTAVGDAAVRVDDSTKALHLGAGAAEAGVKITNARVDLRSGATIRLVADGTGLGFYGSAGVAKQTVTGSRGGNAALASLLTALAAIGLVTDSSTA